MSHPHCWEDYHEWITQEYGTGSEKWVEEYEKPSMTCLLPDGHTGPHEWTPDAVITVTFASGEQGPQEDKT